jgi:hypothetical protein
MSRDIICLVFIVETTTIETVLATFDHNSLQYQTLWYDTTMTITVADI